MPKRNLRNTSSTHYLCKKMKPSGKCCRSTTCLKSDSSSSPSGSSECLSVWTGSTNEVDFCSVGGLEDNINCLKEMILLPLIHHNLFKMFHIRPPRGVLFYGPPGTGKTLVAAALANECKAAKRTVTFFNRNGADCLTKWVGESEKNLRKLFRNAYLNRPAIIFFDEIDGLAPRRCTRQDQVHSSVVSTLLTLMDGLESNTGVVVIGATNRLDVIDPALRRPGRFDKELYFPLPTLQARRAILEIHMRFWPTQPSRQFVEHLASETVGFCGSDLQALCTEAFLSALKRKIPCESLMSSIMENDAYSVNVEEQDFIAAKSKFIPSTLRSNFTPVRKLSTVIQPLLRGTLSRVVLALESVYPFLFTQHKEKPDGLLFCPRLILTGLADQGQTTHLAPALLNYLEHFPVHVLDITALFDGCTSLDCSCVQACLVQKMKGARFQQPSILYMPEINCLWDMLDELAIQLFLRMVCELDSDKEIILLATSNVPYPELPSSIKEVFDESKSLIMPMEYPDASERQKFFQQMFEIKAFPSLEACQKQTSSEENVSQKELLRTGHLERCNSLQRSETRSSRRIRGLGVLPYKSLEDLSRDQTKQCSGKKRSSNAKRKDNKKKRRNEDEQKFLSGSEDGAESCESGLGNLTNNNKMQTSVLDSVKNVGRMKTSLITDEDYKELKSLLQRLVAATENVAVGTLELIYSKMNMSITKCKTENDYSKAVEDLEELTRQYENQRIYTSSYII